jgi:hypothetical protein
MASGRRCATVLALIALLVTASPAAAFFGVVDEVPAATLLIPYFEVHTETRQNARTTIFTVVNTDEVAVVLAHVTLWTNLGLPTVNFTMFLQPRGSQEIDLRTLFIEGELPFAGFGDSCEALSAAMPTSVRNLRAAHKGLAADDLFGGMCGALDIGDDIARGFITVDTVSNCTADTPFSEDYFMDDATSENVLTGHYVIQRDEPLTAVSAPAVHLEASALGGGLESFYYRFGPVESTADGREPLPVSDWSTSYTNGLTDVICWTDQVISNPFDCESPLGVAPNTITIRDHRGDEEYSGPSTLCTVATAKRTVGDMIPQAVAKAGSLAVEVEATELATLSGGGGFTPRRQSFLSAIHRLHPLDLSILVPGVATTGPLIVPLATAAGADQ